MKIICSLFLMLSSVVFVKADTKPKVTDVVTFEMKIGDKPIGNIEIGLFGEIVPITTKNFIELSKREKGKGYTGSKFHRVIKDFMIQGGDYTVGDGTGGHSIYENKDFKDENFLVKHHGAGFVSMANSGKDSNGSQFFIITIKTDFLDGKHVVFGKIIKGMSVVREIEDTKTNKKDKPLEDVVIVSCQHKKVDKPYEVELADATE